jgi:hypothetical protein
MPIRLLFGALLMSLALAACSASSGDSCSSKEDVGNMSFALGDDLQKAEADGKIDRAKTAEAMGRILAAGQTFATNRDRRAYCAALAKIRKDVGL